MVLVDLFGVCSQSSLRVDANKSPLPPQVPLPAATWLTSSASLAAKAFFQLVRVLSEPSVVMSGC